MSADESNSTTRKKALELNLDPLIYGSIAEIGAGQEVARHFFQAGGASGTVARTLSAYDMNFSDAIYGADESGRYVTRGRLESMLQTEYGLLLERVSESRPPESRFFAFADTVAARSVRHAGDWHGWMGIQFQHGPCAGPSRVVIHVRMLDSSNRGQQDALGILGINLIHAAFMHGDDPGSLVDHLVDDLEWGRVEIDYIHFDGPCFDEVDDRQMNLRLVTSSLGPVAMFDADGRPALPADLMHGKDLLLLRGTFRPFLDVHADMARCGLDTFARELGTDEEHIAFFCEMNVARYLSEGLDEASDLLERVEAVTKQGYNAMVTSHLRYFRLSEYFSRRGRSRIGLLASVDNIYTIFDDRYYEGMEGGILEAAGKLFASDTKLLVYPNLTPDGTVVTVENLQVPEHLGHLYQHLVQNRRIVPLEPPRSSLVTFTGTGTSSSTSSNH